MILEHLIPSSLKPYTRSAMYFDRSVPEIQITKAPPRLEEKPDAKSSESKRRRRNPVVAAWKVVFIMAAAAAVLISQSAFAQSGPEWYPGYRIAVPCNWVVPYECKKVPADPPRPGGTEEEWQWVKGEPQCIPVPAYSEEGELSELHLQVRRSAGTKCGLNEKLESALERAHKRVFGRPLDTSQKPWIEQK